MENRYKYLRFFAYTVEILIFFMVQQTPGLIPPILSAKPILLIPIALSIAMFESENAAMAFGLFCGIMVDFGMGNLLGFHGLILAVMCYCIGLMVINLFKTNLLTAIFVGFICLTIIYLLQWVFFFVVFNYEHSLYALIHHYLPGLVYSLAIVPIAFYFNRAFALLLRPKED